MLVTYTAAFGVTPRLSTPVAQAPELRYVCFCDSIAPAVINGWEVKPAVAVFDTQPRRQARWHKVLSHLLFPEADVTLWLDAKLCLAADPRELVTKFFDTPSEMLVFRHPDRDCLYQELEACLQYHKDDPEVMRSQIRRYRQEGYPYHRGLAETSLLLRRHTPAVRQFNEMWWGEIDRGSVRDQLSFDYCTWKLRPAVRAWPGTPAENPCVSAAGETT